MKLFALIAAIGIAATGMSGCVARAHYYVAASPPPPPEARIEVVPVTPGPEHIWVKGHWRWAGNGYEWVPGHWARRPHRYATWEPGHWVREPGGWVWVEGHWRG